MWRCIFPAARNRAGEMARFFPIAELRRPQATALQAQSNQTIRWKDAQEIAELSCQNSSRVGSTRKNFGRSGMTNRKWLGLAALLACASAANGQGRGQARSMVISRYGIVSSESPLASQAGVHILEKGGNAVDAAIATNAMMGVVEPMMNGIGGGF